jgi:hypothetical protein
MPTQFFFATLIKTANILLFCYMFGVHRNIPILLIGLAIAFHPAFLDYHAFSIDATSFELGDSFALLGAVLLARAPRSNLAVLAAGACFTLSIATYQPKLALIASLLTLLVLHDSTRDTPPAHHAAAIVRTLLRAAAAFAIGLVLYLLSIKATTQPGSGERRHVNSLPEIFEQTYLAYGRMYEYFVLRVDYLPKTLFFLPALCLLAALAVALHRAAKAGRIPAALCAAALLALPCAMHLTYIVNSQAWENAGRILFPHAYVLGFALMVLMRQPGLHGAGTAAAAVLAYFFFIGGNHEANAAAAKNVFDINKINRIVARIEQAAPPAPQSRYPVVVIGELPPHPGKRLKRFPNTIYGSQFQTETFIAYRQIELINVFLGREAARSPTPQEQQSALASAATRPPWPAPGAVYLNETTVVVVLAPPSPGVPVTWPAPQ